MLTTPRSRALALALALIVGWEGFSALPYRDSVGIWTNGYGNTAAVTADTPPVTKEQATKELYAHVSVWHAAVARCVTVPLTDTEYAAYVSFTHNVGARAFCQSTLVRLLNAGEHRAACDQLLRWNRAGGRVLRGLTNRRAAERATCLRELPHV